MTTSCNAELRSIRSHLNILTGARRLSHVDEASRLVDRQKLRCARSNAGAHSSLDSVPAEVRRFPERLCAQPSRAKTPVTKYSYCEWIIPFLSF